jgi:hypothetical protein
MHTPLPDDREHLTALVQRIVNVTSPALNQIRLTDGHHKPDAKEIWTAIIRSRRVLTDHFTGTLRFRYAGYKRGAGNSEDATSAIKFKVLEYLWDFSFSRSRITEAIEQANADRLSGKFRLVFVAESEMGTPTEICRDLLKLAEARAPVRCLVYRRPKRNSEHEKMKARMARVLNNHETFMHITTGWLFISLLVTTTTMECEFYTLNEHGTTLTLITPQPL